MTSMVERYDQYALDYEQYWAPVLDATARGLLDRVEPLVRGLGGRARILDIGTGSGVLVVDALARWPDATLVGADISSGMLGLARSRAERAGLDHDGERLRFVTAGADAMPFVDGSFDIAISSFVFQLVPDRARALAETLRVLRPGGRLALVTWLDRADDFAPAVEFDEAVYDVGIEEEEEEKEEEGRAGDFRSVRAAADELRRAGFERVSARLETLEFPWSRESYLDFKVHYDERTLMSSLDDDVAERLTARARERFTELPPDSFIWRTGVVSVVGRRPT